MVNFLVKSSLCLLLLMLFYSLFLEKEKIHQFKRFYLLGSIVFSMLAPLFIVYVKAEPIEVTQIITPIQNTEREYFLTETIAEEEPFDYQIPLLAVYGIVGLFLLLKFVRNIYQLLKTVKQNEGINYKKAVLVLLSKETIPHTFWRYIFINKHQFHENQNDELLTHELTHVRQKHSIDILLIEFLKILFWFNPLFYMLKRFIQLNHEFLADAQVIKQNNDVSSYQQLLLQNSTQKYNYQLTSNLNYLVTKKRLNMMTKETHKNVWLRQLAILPLLTGLFFVFAERVEAQESTENDPQILNAEVLKAYQEYGFRNTYFYTKDENNNKVKVPFSMLENKKKVGPPEPLILKKKIISKDLLDILKEGRPNKIVFIDNVVVSKDELKKYNPSDFSYHSMKFANHNSKINRRMGHYFLETPKYFENQNEKRKNEFLEFLEEKKLQINATELNTLVTHKSKNYSVESYLSQYHNYESRRNTKPHFINKTKENKQILTNSFTFLEEQYAKLSDEDKKMVKKPIQPIYPYKKIIKNNNVFYKFGEDILEEKEIKTQKSIEKPNSKLADFNIKIEKNESTFKLKCAKGCNWDELTFELNENESKIVDQFGAGNKTDYSSDFKILVKNIERKYTDYTFTVESLKGTNWLNRAKLYTTNKTEITQHKY